ncbi:hypothetical protein [Intestinimonas butyriciproducens]|uniref:hypothetical protein n=1 Tax=Intestinimonas butyriciproducens TaxID=1297617 RepID=UPI000E30C198|nr:hypothetical protein [Intestinimonas butyriciproducens]MCR1907072.1 hypothetical protein [Intestinimonas butyriciproducens]
MDKWTHITIFDKPYPKAKQAEGLAISQAVAGGHCDKCGCFSQCSAQDDFCAPTSAWCMQRKIEILREMEQ